MSSSRYCDLAAFMVDEMWLEAVRSTDDVIYIAVPFYVTSSAAARTQAVQTTMQTAVIQTIYEYRPAPRFSATKSGIFRRGDWHFPPRFAEAK